MLLAHKVFHNTYHAHALKQLVAFSQTSDPATARNAYYVLATYYEEGIQLDYRMILYHMNFPSVQDSALSLLLAIKELPASLAVSDALIKAAKTSEKAGLLLQKYADTSINQANVFLYDSSWTTSTLPTFIDTMKLLMQHCESLKEEALNNCLEMSGITGDLDEEKLEG